VETNPRGYPVDISPVDNKIAVTLAPGERDGGNNFVDAEETAKNTADVEDAPLPDIGICSEGPRHLQGRWSSRDVCNIYAPGEVVNFHITCSSGGTYIYFQIADCCIPGDHWQLKGKNWDIFPQTAVTTSPGGNFAYSAPGRVYTYSGSGRINALVECSYLHGVNVFGAGSYVYFQSDAASCTVQKLAVDARIDRSP